MEKILISSLMRLWIGLSIIRCLILSIFFICPSCPELSELTPAQVRSPVSLASQAQTRTNNITGPIGYGESCSYRLKKSKFFSRRKIFSNFSFFQAGRANFLFDFCQIFRVFRENSADFFIFDWHFGSISLELFVQIRTIFAQKFTKKS